MELFPAADKGRRTSSNKVGKGAKFEVTREEVALAPPTDRGRAGRKIAENGQSGPIVKRMRRHGEIAMSFIARQNGGYSSLVKAQESSIEFGKELED